MGLRRVRLGHGLGHPSTGMPRPVITESEEVHAIDDVGVRTLALSELAVAQCQMSADGVDKSDDIEWFGQVVAGAE
jgi:hypothetical protein